MTLAATDLEKVFGTVNPPKELKPLIDQGGQGAGGINLFINNLITLIYEVALVLVVFMLLWGGVQLILSGGDKEAVSGAQKRITFALIGLIFLAVAFALLQAFGVFTGFTTFFGFF
ncbi:MAG: hypothetical protein Q7R49_06435 [Candidatus Daviesbacteria bacterium]|nr:hypothetical protein [Candidatus Daviesbacteria bacterium]